MAFDSSNFVAPDPNNPGMYLTYIGGSPVGTGLAQSQAEQLYNSMATGSAVNAPDQFVAPAATPGGGDLARMTSELQAAGYGGPWDPSSIQAAYARTVNGGNAARGVFPGMEMFNIGAEQLKVTAAKDAAYQAYLYAQLEFQKEQYNGLSAYQKEQLAIQKASEAADQALKAMGLVAQLRGPSNAFQQQAVMSGLNSAGLSKAVDAIAGTYRMPSFQAPQAAAEPATLQTMARDIGAAGGMPTATGTAATPSPGTLQSYLAALPAPNQINARNFMQLPASTKDFLMSGYASAGYDPADVLDTIKNLLPQFKVPSLGSVA